MSKTLFGTLNEDDAKFYDNQINKIRANEESLLTLIKNQTSIIETTGNILNKTQIKFDQQLSVLNTKLLLVQSMVDEIYNETQINRIALELESFTSLIKRYQNAVNTIVNIVTDARHGKPHPIIITPSQIESILTTVRKEIPDNIKLSTTLKNDNILPVYRISQMSSTVYNQKIIYELRIPLPYKENFLLYKVIPLPVTYRNQFLFILPSMDYLVVDYDREHYYDMSATELSNCITEDHDQFLCRIMHPIFNTNPDANICEVNLIRRESILPSTCNLRQSNHSTFWIQLSQVNKWLFSAMNAITGDVICQDKITPLNLSGAGILEIQGDCYIRTRELVIRAYNTKKNNLKNSFIPPINITDLIRETGPSPTNLTRRLGLIRYTQNTELESLSRRISEQKKEENKGLIDLDAHNIHHYSFIYTLLLVILAGVIIWLWPKVKQGLANRRQTEPAEVQEDEQIDQDTGVEPNEGQGSIKLTVRR